MSTPGTPQSLNTDQVSSDGSEGPPRCYVAVTLQAALSGEFLASTEFLLDGHPAEPSLGAILAWAATVRPERPVPSRTDVVFESRPGRSVSCLSRPCAKIRNYVEDLPVQPDRAGRLDECVCYDLAAALVELSEEVPVVGAQSAWDYFSHKYTTDPVYRARYAHLPGVQRMLEARLGSRPLRVATIARRGCSSPERRRLESGLLYRGILTTAQKAEIQAEFADWKEARGEGPPPPL